MLDMAENLSKPVQSLASHVMITLVAPETSITETEAQRMARFSIVLGSVASNVSGTVYLSTGQTKPVFLLESVLWMERKVFTLKSLTSYTLAQFEYISLVWVST